MMRLICLFLTMVITVFIQASITTYRLILAEDGTLINDITMLSKLYHPKMGPYGRSHMSSILMVWLRLNK